MTLKGDAVFDAVTVHNNIYGSWVNRTRKKPRFMSELMKPKKSAITYLT